MLNVHTKTTAHPNRVGMEVVALRTIQLPPATHVLVHPASPARDVSMTWWNAQVVLDLVIMGDALIHTGRILVCASRVSRAEIVMRNTFRVSLLPVCMVEDARHWIS